MKTTKHTFLILLMVSVIGIFGQNPDSLKIALKSATSDTTKCKVLYSLMVIEPSDAICTGYAKEIVRLCEANLKTCDNKSTLGVFYLRTVADAYSNLASYTLNKSDYATSLDYLNKALKIQEKIGDKKGMVLTTISVGDYCSINGNLDEALSKYKEAYQIGREIKSKEMVAFSLSKIGYVFYVKKNYASALENLTKAKIVSEEIKDNTVIEKCRILIAKVYKDTKEYEKALELLEVCLQAREQEKDTAGISAVMQNIADVLTEKKDFKSALSYAKKAYDYSMIQKNPQLVMWAANSLRKAYAGTNQPAKALEMYEVYVQMKDVVNNESNRKAIVRNQLQTQYDKKALADSLRVNEERKIAGIEIETQQTQKAGLYAILILVIIFSGVLFNRFQLTKKQKTVIEDHQKDILDSITYAKRLQQAILPPENLIKEHLPESFILYKPKDIVAGDFYWMENVGGLVLFAAADCTGHGVPGAMMSVVCSNALNRAVREFELTLPGAILDKVRELVIATFEKSGTEIKDGMDISLCCLNKKDNSLSWAGANNPLWIYKFANKSITEIQPNKQPIGNYDNAKPFTTQEMLLQENDILYLFTDGFADQFGGPKGKKLMYKKMKEQLLNNSMAYDGRMGMETHKDLLEGCFNSWMGNLEQVDDVCVIGVKIGNLK